VDIIVISLTITCSLDDIAEQLLTWHYIIRYACPKVQ
jgi:hypothetical protein